jgi:tRNA threonylcarbamoyladenosine biosynthesis protein TsaB
MNVLAFDTSTEIFSICLDTDDNHFEFSCSMGFRHSETLVTEIDSFLGRESISAADLDLIVCTRGPGSFTGLRIAMATAKGLSLGSSTPMVSIQTLDMLAYGLEYFNGVVVPIIDARKKRFYTAIYQGSKKQSDNLDLSPEDIILKLKDYDNILLTGPDAVQFFKLVGSDSRFSIDTNSKRPWAGNLIPLGKGQFINHGASTDDEGPLYLRRSEAEIGITIKP